MKDLVEALKNKNKTISSMESCTGGALANEITNIEGCSDVIKYSAVTYSNEFKIKMGVSKEVIDKYTVYSVEVAKEMSRAICDFSKASYGIGITGKLNRADKNNNYGKDNVVFISIYDSHNNKYFTKDIEVVEATRKLNKDLVINEIIKIIKKIL